MILFDLKHVYVLPPTKWNIVKFSGWNSRGCISCWLPVLSNIIFIAYTISKKKSSVIIGAAQQSADRVLFIGNIACKKKTNHLF